MNRVIFLSVLFLLSIRYGKAQNVLTLEKAISIGLENNFQIKIDEANIRIAENNNSWARAGRAPTVDLNGTFNPNLVNDNNPASFLNGVYLAGGLGANIDVNWTLFSGGRIQVAKEQLELLGGQQRLLKEASINDVIRNIVQGYQDVLLQKERLTVLRESYILSDKRLDYEETRKEFGASNSFNIAQFEEAVLGDSINILNQLELINLSKQSLYSVLNINPDQSYAFEGVLKVTLEDLDLEKIRATLEEENYTLKNLRVLEDLSKINTRIAQSARKPMIGVSASFGVSENYFKFYKDDPSTGEPFPGAFSNRINLGIGANFSYNLSDGGNRKKDIENAIISEEIAQLNILNTTVNLNNQIRTLINNYENQKNILLLNDQQLVVVERNLEMAEERYKSGIISSVDYRAIQNQYLAAAFNKTSSIFNLIITKSEIDWLVGTYNR